MPCSNAVGAFAATHDETDMSKVDEKKVARRPKGDTHVGGQHQFNHSRIEGDAQVQLGDVINHISIYITNTISEVEQLKYVRANDGNKTNNMRLERPGSSHGQLSTQLDDFVSLLQTTLEKTRNFKGQSQAIDSESLDRLASVFSSTASELVPRDAAPSTFIYQFDPVQLQKQLVVASATLTLISNSSKEPDDHLLADVQVQSQSDSQSVGIQDPERLGVDAHLVHTYARDDLRLSVSHMLTFRLPSIVIASRNQLNFETYHGIPNRMQSWWRDPTSSILTIQEPNDTPSPSSLATGTASLCQREHKGRVVRVALCRSLQGLMQASPTERYIQLLNSIIAKLIYLNPPIFTSHFDFTKERFDSLDNISLHHQQRLDIIRDLLLLHLTTTTMPRPLLIVLDGLQLLDESSQKTPSQNNTVPELIRNLFSLFETTRATGDACVKTVVFASGQSILLRSNFHPTSIVNLVFARPTGAYLNSKVFSM